MVHLNFVNKGTDEQILKSLPTENISEELIKAIGKEGLVQKDVTVKGKNGQTFTRKQWVKASDAQKEGTKGSSTSENSEGLDEKTSKMIESMSVDNLEKRKGNLELTIKHDGDKVARDSDNPTKPRADGKTVKEIYQPLLDKINQTLEEKKGGSKSTESEKEKPAKGDKKETASSKSPFTSDHTEDISLGEFLEDVDDENIQNACKEAGLSDGVIISSDTTDGVDDIDNFLKESKKVKSFGDGTSVYENSGNKFVYHSENGSQAIYMSKSGLKS